jgi:glycine C-acetyltransferase
MYPAAFQETLQAALEQAKADGLYKEEHAIAGGQGAWVTLDDGRRVLNMCANNYLGLSSHPAIVAAARAALDDWGYGVSSVRFICGTQSLHQELEAALSEFLGTEDAILYSSCFDANGGLFETILSADDAIISDELNHASIIDGVRLCKARRLRYRNADMDDLEARLKEASSRWTASSRRWRRSAIWRSATTPWSWSTIPTRWACSGQAAAAPTSTAM